MNVLVTSFDNQEDVMIIGTSLPARIIEKALRVRGAIFGEVYEVPENERGLYIYDPLFADQKFDNDALRIANT